MYPKRIITDFEYYLIDSLTDPQNCVDGSFRFEIEGTTIFVFTYVIKEYDRYHNEVNDLKLEIKNGKIMISNVKIQILPEMMKNIEKLLKMKIRG